MLLQLKITLKGSKPSIWRRVWIQGDRPLEHLHYLIQFIFSWGNSHLHQFIQGKSYYDMPGTDPDFELGEPAEEFMIYDLLDKPKAKLDYEYDFGDGWIHEVVVEKVGSSQIPVEPMVVTGKRAGPPEDCGGIYGYMHLLEVLSDPSHSDHESTKEWVGEGFEPEQFDLNDLNQMLENFDDEVVQWEKWANEENEFF